VAVFARVSRSRSELRISQTAACCIGDEFAITFGVLYFDHNATHPLSAAAKKAWLDAVERFPANPSSQHRPGQRADAALDGARESLAAKLGCAASAIVFTSGATESSNAVLHHIARSTDGEAWISAIEHPCAIEGAQHWLPGRHRLLPVTSEGRLDVAFLASELRKKKPALVALMAANNETGVLQPWREVQALCAESGVPFFCDAAQWMGKMPATALGACDFVSGCAHKFGGPVGVGFLKCPGDFRSLLAGGPQEDRRRAGTQNVAGVLSMIAALENCAPRVGDDRIWFENELLRALPGTQLLGRRDAVLWNTVCAVMPEHADCRRRWVVVLDRLGFAVSTGSACSSGKEKPSHVLLAMGFTTAEAGRALRFSGGWETTREDWARLLGGICAAARELGVISNDE
jgi:cysteine desulfurase